MSGIGGLLNLDGGRVPAHLLASLAPQIARTDAEAPLYAMEGHVGMVYRKFATTPEENRNDYLWHEPEKILAALDGYLIAPEGLLRNKTPRAGDLDMVLHLYEQGQDVGSSTTGDFAVAILDSRLRQLTLCRDAFGTRGLFYCRYRNYLVWSSTVDALVCGGFAPLAIDEVYVAQYLNDDPDPRRTPFKEISAVPPAHSLIVLNGSISLRKWWNPRIDCQRSIKDDECTERFGDLFQDSVQARLRTNSNVIALLSGGLDSSSIVCVSDKIHRQKSLAPLKTLSFVFGSPESDEREFIGCIESMRSMTGFHISDDQVPILSVLPEPDFIGFPAPLFCFGDRIGATTRLLKDFNIRTILSGWGGDEVLLGGGPWAGVISDHLRSLEIKLLFRDTKQWASQLGQSVPRILLDALRQALRGSGSPTPSAERIPWLPIPMRLIANSPRGSNFCTLPERIVNSKQHHANNISRTIRPVAAGYACLPTMRASFDVRFPFLDRGLVEFVLSTPNEQYQRPDEIRSLLRRAMKGIVPEAVRTRTGKSGPTSAIIRALKSNATIATTLLKNSRAAARGFVNGQLLSESLEKVRRGWGSEIPELLRALSLEIWLRNLENLKIVEVTGSNGHQFVELNKTERR